MYKELLPLDTLIFDLSPFPHFSSDRILSVALADELLSWLKKTELWHFTETDFYTQYEFSLLEVDLPENLDILSANGFIDRMKNIFIENFDTLTLELVGITAHKLVNGHKMGVHNDFIGREETHRLIIQLNSNWNQDNGGYLMLFGSKNPQEVSKLLIPIHNTGIGFEISDRSYHAVSTIHDFERYTLVYTFNER